MANIHEIKLGGYIFDQLQSAKCAIVRLGSIQQSDVVLIKQVIGDDEVETGVYTIGQVREIVHMEGLMPDYALIIMTELK